MRQKSTNTSKQVESPLQRQFGSSPLLLHTTGRSKKKDKCKNTQMYPLSETQYCPCDKYNAQPVGNWSDCILPEGGRVESVLGMKVQGDIKECGQGYRYQAMVCYDQDNRLVETSRCNSHGECMCLSLQSLFSFVSTNPPHPPMSPTAAPWRQMDFYLWGSKLWQIKHKNTHKKKKSPHRICAVNGIWSKSLLSLNEI